MRCIRRIEGDITVYENQAFQHFEDSVCAINDFDRRDFLYEVPLRSLVRTGFDNLMTAGRSASADGYAWDVFRVIPPAILTGQAAAVTVVVMAVPIIIFVLSQSQILETMASSGIKD